MVVTYMTRFVLVYKPLLDHIQSQQMKECIQVFYLKLLSPLSVLNHGFCYRRNCFKIKINYLAKVSFFSFFLPCVNNLGTVIIINWSQK